MKLALGQYDREAIENIKKMELFPISNKNIFCNVTLKKLECRFVGFHSQIVIGIIYAAGYIRVFIN